MAHADGRLSDEDYLARVASVRREQAAAPPARAGAAVPADRALAYLRNLAETWANPGIRPETRAQVIHAVYERIEVRGLDFAEVKLTPEAYAHGLALALPERVSRVRAGLACPRGLRHAEPCRNGNIANLSTQIRELTGCTSPAYSP